MASNSIYSVVPYYYRSIIMNIAMNINDAYPKPIFMNKQLHSMHIDNLYHRTQTYSAIITTLHNMFMVGLCKEET